MCAYMAGDVYTYESEKSKIHHLAPLPSTAGMSGSNIELLLVRSKAAHKLKGGALEKKKLQWGY